MFRICSLFLLFVSALLAEPAETWAADWEAADPDTFRTRPGIA